MRPPHSHENANALRRRADDPRLVRWLAWFIVVTLSAMPVAGAAQFEIPPMPGWTDASPGAPKGNLGDLAPDELAMARSGRYAALAFDKRARIVGSVAMFQVVLLDMVLPITADVPHDLVEKIVAGLNGRLVSSEIVRTASGPRLRIELDAQLGNADARLVQFAIPGRSKSAFAIYSVPRVEAKRYLREIDAHAARIVPTDDGPTRPDGPRQALCLAVRTGSKDRISRALAAGGDVAAECDLTTPLGLAAIAGDLEAARLLLRAGANANQHYGLPLRTALMDAAKSGRLEMLKLLLDAGAAVNARNKFGRTALYYTETPTPPLTPPPNAAEVAAYLRRRGGIR
jgi:hypothetical protein